MRAASLSRRSFSRLRSSELFPSLQLRFFKSDNGGGRTRNDSSFESVDDFERRLFGDTGDGSDEGSFFRRLEKIEKAHGRSVNGWRDIDGGNSGFMNSQREGFDTLSDGMDSKLKKAATSFEFSAEIMDDDYQFRPDVTFRPGTTYTPKDLDLTKPGIPRPFKRTEFETTTAEVLKKADFRNVRFLSNFLTEAGIIIKRSQTKISAKAQRKIAREIKTARALGLMPFTTMGTKPFIFGRTMKDDDEESAYESYGVSGSATLDYMSEVDAGKSLPR